MAKWGRPNRIPRVGFVLYLGIYASVVGCGGGNPESVGIDGGGTSDGGNDGQAPPIDGSAATCDLVAQTGCDAGQKCAWVRVAVAPNPIGVLGCVPDGNVDQGGSCTYGASGDTTGYDNCKKGLTCGALMAENAVGTCRATCSLTAAAPGTQGTCPVNHLCVSHAAFFTSDDASPREIGLCEPLVCDPLTQRRLSDGAPNCGGTIDATASPPQPSLGCYGMPSATAEPTVFSCVSAGPAANRNGVICETSNSCGPYVNGCAPGFAPLLEESPGSSKMVCAALCAPDDTSLESHPNPGGKAPFSCADAGAGGTYECRYWWWFEGANTPLTPVSNGLGVCVDYLKRGEPSCTTLSRTGHNYSQTASDAEVFGCVKVTKRP